jgi:outer membrane receptor protein involved in Fe transport
MGAGINLRGVGSESTLVLVDGRRLASAGRGEYSDISMIPLAAVERIEVVTDGASALYGSDAIGGVVNFIMRKDFSGAETRVRYGDSTRGGLSQKQVSQVLGTQWGSGNVLAAYEYFDQAALSRYDRDFSDNAPGSKNGPRALLPGEERHGVSVFGKQQIASRVIASANAMYSRRDSERWDWDEDLDLGTNVRREQMGGSVGVGVELSETWRAQFSGGYDQGTAFSRQLQNPAQGAAVPYDFAYDTKYDLWSTDLLVSGDLIPLPWGAVKLAAGAGYRKETFDYQTFRSGALLASPGAKSVTVRSAYTEISAPFGERGNRAHAPLTLSLAGRYDEYDTFGGSFDPTYGLRWMPLGALSLYATYGTSFKAPNLYQSQENPFFNTSVIYNNRLPGVARGLILSGGNAGLMEQTAQTFTAGIEFNAAVAGGLRARLNYFDIDYDDRIQGVGASPVAVFTTPGYRSQVTLRGDVPDAEFNEIVARYLAGDRARVLGCTVALSPTGACASPVESFGAIVDVRQQNFASVQVQGLDLSLSQDVTWHNNQLNFTLDGSYFLTFDEQLTPFSPEQDILNRLYKPVDLRVRGSATWSRVHWSSTLSVNYTTDYSTRGTLLRSDDTTPMTPKDIASWTTLDWTLKYTVAGENSGFWLDGLAMSLSVLNVLDKDPPYVDDRYYGLGYDPANADPRGRMLSLTVSKQW